MINLAYLTGESPVMEGSSNLDGTVLRLGGLDLYAYEKSCYTVTPSLYILRIPRAFIHWTSRRFVGKP